MKGQHGLVSLITVVFFSILILIVTMSTLMAQTKELRQSTDTDQSVRAYYAAESGLEAALNYLKVHGTNQRQAGCTGPILDSVPPLERGAEITCLRVVDNSIDFSGDLAQEMGTEADLKNLTTLDRIDLKWGSTFDGSDLNYTDLPQNLPGHDCPSPCNHPPRSTWAIPALMELTIYSYPTTNVAPGDIQAHTILLRPSSRTESHEASFSVNDQIQPVKCDRTGYTCQVSIRGIPTRTVPGRSFRYLVRFRPRYNSTKYVLEAFGSGSAGSAGVKIDVTARTGGNIYRRLVATSASSGNLLNVGLDYVIFTRQDICKDFKVRSNDSRYITGTSGTGPGCLTDPDPPEDTP